VSPVSVSAEASRRPDGLTRRRPRARAYGIGALCIALLCIQSDSLQHSRGPCRRCCTTHIGRELRVDMVCCAGLVGSYGALRLSTQQGSMLARRALAEAAFRFRCLARRWQLRHWEGRIATHSVAGRNVALRTLGSRRGCLGLEERVPPPGLSKPNLLEGQTSHVPTSAKVADECSQGAWLLAVLRWALFC